MALTERLPVAATAEGQRRATGSLSANLRAVYIIWYRDLIRYVRDRFRLVASLAQPLLYLIIFGTGLSSSLRGAGGGFSAGGSISYIQFLFGGVIGMAVLFSSMFSAMSIVWDREFGFLKEILVAPIDRWSVAVGKTLGGATQAWIQGAILLVLAPVAGVKLTLLSVAELVPLIFILAFGLTALGVAVASRMHSMQGFQGIMNFLMMPMFFLSGALFPLRGLPGWMTVLTRLDPAAYGLDPLRRVVLSGTNIPSQVLDQLGLTIGGQVLPVALEAAMMMAFGVLMLSFAIFNFRVRD